MKDQLILKFQQYLPKYIEDEYCASRKSPTGWITKTGNYDKHLCLSDNQTKNGNVICPVCGKISDFEPDHGDGYNCGKCNAFIRTYGNGMYIWDGSLKIIRKKKLEQILMKLNK